MLSLNNVFSDSAKQTEVIRVPNRTATFTLNLTYLAQNSAWYYDIIYPQENFTLKGIKITNNLNLLSPWQNKLKFGLAFICTDGLEPWYQNDFTSGRVNIFLLDENDINTTLAKIFTNEV